MQEFGRIISKYLFPLLLTIMGLFLLLISSGQTIWFKVAGAGILLVGVLGFLFVKGVISKVAQIILTVCIALGAILMGYKNYDVIEDRLEYEKKRDLVNMHIIQRLKDIRKAQLAYYKEHNKYTPSFDTLIDFLKNGELSLVKRLGALPDTVPTEEMARELGLIQQMPEGMTDAEVIAANMIVRDTIMVDVLGYVFNEDDMESRKTKFYVDSLPYVPFADHKFIMETNSIESGGITQSVFQVKDPDPFEQQFIVGSLQEASTSGNWKE